MVRKIQEHLESVLKDAVGCIIVFSLDSTNLSRQQILDRFGEFDESRGKHIQIVLVANKADLPADQIEFTDWESEGKSLLRVI